MPPWKEKRGSARSTAGAYRGDSIYSLAAKVYRKGCRGVAECHCEGMEPRRRKAFPTEDRIGASGVKSLPEIAGFTVKTDKKRTTKTEFNQ